MNKEVSKVKNHILYYRFIYKLGKRCYSNSRTEGQPPGKGKDMISIRFALSYNDHPECLSSRKHLDGLFVSSYKEQKRGYVIPQ